MTLCMAAHCMDGYKRLIVVTADNRAEKDWAGGNVANKFGWAASPGWPALMAGEPSKAEDLLATCSEILKPAELTDSNIFDKLNEVVAAHREKLIKRLVQQRLGVTYERFLTKGEVELSAEVRSRLLYDITNLEFGCSVITFGYITGQPYLFSIDSEGEVTNCQNFACIGTGAVIADSTLYQREQSAFDSSLERTLYNLYEAAELARIAPGVGKTRYFAVFEPAEWEAEGVELRVLASECTKDLARLFGKYGPKRVVKNPELHLAYDASIKPAQEVAQNPRTIKQISPKATPSDRAKQSPKSRHRTSVKARKR